MIPWKQSGRVTDRFRKYCGDGEGEKDIERERERRLKKKVKLKRNCFQKKNKDVTAGALSFDLLDADGADGVKFLAVMLLESVIQPLCKKDNTEKYKEKTQI